MSREMSRTADALLRYHASFLAQHGDTARGAGWPNEQDRLTRFDVVLDIIARHRPNRPVVLCDLGCGSGELARRAHNFEGLRISYVGIDRSEEALSYARAKFPADQFHLLDVLTASEWQLDSLRCDFMTAIGLFTAKGTVSHAEMWEFMSNVIRRTWPLVSCGLVFNVMSKAVDWEREDLFHVSYDELAVFLHSLAGRRIGFRADYGLYEFMAYALKPQAFAGVSRR
ncbi:MAG TPA: methyltransferase domain-containing protein [Pyrinomonadaceae bacterium]|nr:methyltransferase domain-containing protein [Pyrinomonadaceae bacterium]